MSRQKKVGKVRMVDLLDDDWVRQEMYEQEIPDCLGEVRGNADSEDDH